MELDGWEFHRTRDDFEADRERDADTLQAGFRTLRVTWRRLHERAATEAERLRSIMDSGL